MKIDKEKVKERLQGVPVEHQSHIYNATIVLEFLSQTFMPTKFFLPREFKPTPGVSLGKNSMRKLSDVDGRKMTLTELYDLYTLFREEKDYTAGIESRYIFGIIVRNLRYYRNKWELHLWRVSTAQTWHIGPLVMRKDVSTEARDKFKVEDGYAPVEQTTVNANPIAEPEDEEEEIVVDRFKEVMTDFYEKTYDDLAIKIATQPSVMQNRFKEV